MRASPSEASAASYERSARPHNEAKVIGLPGRRSQPGLARSSGSSGPGRQSGHRDRRARRSVPVPRPVLAREPEARPRCLPLALAGILDCESHGRPADTVACGEVAPLAVPHQLTVADHRSRRPAARLPWSRRWKSSGRA